MAGLVDDLIEVLKQEEKIYRIFEEYGEQKRQILIKADVPALEKLTSEEQTTNDELLAASNRQTHILEDIATVLGKTKEQMTVTRLIELMSTQPEVQKRLIEARDELLATAGRGTEKNRQNELLIQQAIEMAEFDITLIKSMRQAPETANYNKDAYNTGALLGSSGFDAKQ